MLNQPERRSEGWNDPSGADDRLGVDLASENALGGAFRVLVIGSSGAGKSHFAQRLGEATGLPVTHLDELYWLPNWQRRHSAGDWRSELKKVTGADRWIVDGNYPDSLELRAERADLAIVLRYSRWVCLYRAVTRAWLNRRPDDTVLHRETLDWEFIRIIWRFPKVGRREIERLRALPNLRIVVLRNDDEAERFLRAATHRGPGDDTC